MKMYFNNYIFHNNTTIGFHLILKKYLISKIIKFFLRISNLNVLPNTQILMLFVKIFYFFLNILKPKYRLSDTNS